MKKIVVIGEQENVKKVQEVIKDIDVEINESLEQEWMATTLESAFDQFGKELTREESLELADKYLADNKQWENFDQDMCEWVADWMEEK